MKKRYLIFLCLFISTWVSAQSLNRFQDDGSQRILSARALGLGGSYISVADDASALHWNPAALAFLPGPSVVLGGGYQYNLGGLSITDLYTGGATLTQTTETSEKSGKFLLNQASVAVPIYLDRYEGIKVTPAFGYALSSNFQHLNEKWIYSRSFYDEFGQNVSIDETFTFDQSGGRKDFTFGVGLSINEHLSFGFAQHLYTGSRVIKNTYVNSYNGNNSAYSGIYDFHGKRSTFALKYASYSEPDITLDGYDPGADVSLVVDLPTILSTSINENGLERVSHYRRDASYKLGFSTRSESVLFCMDAMFESGLRNSGVISQGNVLTRFPSDSLNTVSVGAGLEAGRIFRFGVRGKQYQFRNEEREQPWTVQLNTGLTFSDYNHMFNFDITASFEFYNWEKVLWIDEIMRIDNKGTMLNILATFRMVIPYK